MIFIRATIIFVLMMNTALTSECTEYQLKNFVDSLFFKYGISVSDVGTRSLSEKISKFSKKIYKNGILHDGSPTIIVELPSPFEGFLFKSISMWGNVDNNYNRPLSKL
jgi:hypothetical protein